MLYFHVFLIDVLAQNLLHTCQKSFHAEKVDLVLLFQSSCCKQDHEVNPASVLLETKDEPNKKNLTANVHPIAADTPAQDLNSFDSRHRV